MVYGTHLGISIPVENLGVLLAKQLRRSARVFHWYAADRAGGLGRRVIQPRINAGGTEFVATPRQLGGIGNLVEADWALCARGGDGV